MSHDGSKVPASVLLVHGLWMNGAGTWWLRHRLRETGFAAESFNYPTMQGTAAEVADRLSEAVAALPPPVHLVGHSLGGLIVLKLFERHPEQPPGRVVLLGSPVAGSGAARAVANWAIGPALLGPLASGELILAPSRRWAQPRELGVIAGTVSAGMGRVVAALPEPNDGTVAVEETRLEGVTEHITLPTTHTGMLFSASVAGQVARFLGSGSFRPPAPRAAGHRPE